MIRINLIEEARQRATPAGASAWSGSLGGSEISTAMKGGLAAIAGAVLLLAGHYFFLQYQASSLQKQTATAQTENAHLLALQREYNANVQRRQELQKRIDLILALRHQQIGPSDLLVALGGAVNRSPYLWLTSVESKPDGITLSGGARSLDAVADLITGLRQSGYFKQVDLKEGLENAPTLQGPGSFTFSLLAQPLSPAAPAAPPRS